MKKISFKTQKASGRLAASSITQAAIIGAMYAAMTILIPGGSGQVQVRVSEALTVLPFLTPAAIPGLFIGCLISNIFVGAGPFDIVIGSMATLAAAFATYKMPKSYLAPLPPVIINAVAVAAVLKLAQNLPFLVTMGFVALGESIACYVLGLPLLLILQRSAKGLFTRNNRA